MLRWESCEVGEGPSELPSGPSRGCCFSSAREPENARIQAVITQHGGGLSHLQDGVIPLQDGGLSREQIPDPLELDRRQRRASRTFWSWGLGSRCFWITHDMSGRYESEGPCLQSLCYPWRLHVTLSPPPAYLFIHSFIHSSFYSLNSLTHSFIHSQNFHEEPSSEIRPLFIATEPQIPTRPFQTNKQTKPLRGTCL